MKTCAIALVVALLSGVGLEAVENSNIYMPLVQSATFTNRVQYILAMQAPVVQVEAVAYTQPTGDTHPVSAACHTRRVNLATLVVVGPSSYAPVFSVFLASNINVTSGGTLTGSGATLDTPATDAALLAAVAAIWSSVAGCVTNP